MPTVDNSCRARRKDGQPCTVKATADGFCFAHSQVTAHKRKAARAAGGRGSATKERLAKRMTAGPLATVQEVLLSSIAGVLRGRITPAQAGGVAALTSALCKVYEMNEAAAALREMEERLAQLEHSERAPHGSRGTRGTRA